MKLLEFKNYFLADIKDIQSLLSALFLYFVHDDFDLVCVKFSGYHDEENYTEVALI